MLRHIERFQLPYTRQDTYFAGTLLQRDERDALSRDGAYGGTSSDCAAPLWDTQLYAHAEESDNLDSGAMAHLTT